MSKITFDATVDYEEKDKSVVHDISIQLSPKAARPGHDEKRKKRRRVARRVFTGRYLKRKGGFASQSYARRYPKLVKRLYKTRYTYRVVEVTVHIPGAPWTDADAFKAFWAAHKIVQKGGNLETDLRDWTVEAINWRKGGKPYDYTSSQATEVIGAMGGILEDEDTRIRVGLVDHIEPERK